MLSYTETNYQYQLHICIIAQSTETHCLCYALEHALKYNSEIMETTLKKDKI